MGFQNLWSSLTLRERGTIGSSYYQVSSPSSLLLCVVNGSCYRKHRWAPVFPGDYDTFLEPIKSCGRFLMERASWLKFQDRFVMADMVCEEKNSLTWAHILNTASLARPLIEEALPIPERLLPPDDMDLSDAYNNYGFMLLVESQEPQTMREAAKYFDMARLLDENTRMDTRFCTLDISIWERPMQCLGIMLRRNGSMRLGGTTQRKRTGEERTSWEGERHILLPTQFWCRSRCQKGLGYLRSVLRGSIICGSVTNVVDDLGTVIFSVTSASRRASTRRQRPYCSSAWRSRLGRMQRTPSCRPPE